MPEQGLYDQVKGNVVKVLREMPPAMAGAMGPPTDAKKLSEREERELFWRRAPGVDEQTLREQGVPDEDIWQQVYPDALRLMRQGERMFSVKKQVQYVNRMVAAGPPDLEASDER